MIKRCLIISLSLFAASSFILCTDKGSRGPGNIFKMVQDSYTKEGVDAVKKYYTEGTIKAMDELKMFSSESNESNYFDSYYSRGVKWEVEDEQVDGDSATIKIKYLEHPVEKMKGIEVPFNMRKEDGEWKIDMEKEMKGIKIFVEQQNKAVLKPHNDFINKLKKLGK